MRILDQESDRPLSNIVLYFTQPEAIQMLGALEDLLAAPTANHVHVPQDDYQKEVTVCIYDANNLSADNFSQRSLRLIGEDK